LVFESEEDYKEGVSLLGICAKLFPEVTIFTFQIMSNHLHLVAAGTQQKILEMFDLFRNRLEKYIGFKGKLLGLKEFKLKLFQINNLDYFRNAIAYTNRNGFVVKDDTTPFSYPWGANSLFFNPLAQQYHKTVQKPFTGRNIRAVFHGKGADSLTGLYMVDGMISPLCFCNISFAEASFHDAKSYFNKISKNVESYREIGEQLSESIYYTDDDLFSITKKYIKEQFGQNDPTLLSSSQKIETAQKLHFEYHASNKQIQRFLKIGLDIINSMFP